MPTDLFSRAAAIPPDQRTHFDTVKATRKMRWWYEHLADYMIAHPTVTQNELAIHFNRAPGTISTVINTDAFKAYLRQRRAQYESSLDSEVRGKLLNVANRSLDFLLEGLEKKRDTIPIDTLQKLAEGSLKNLGYGETKTPAVAVNVHAPPTVNVAVGLDDLQLAREALRNSQQTPLPALGGGAPPVISQPPVEVDPDE